MCKKSIRLLGTFILCLCCSSPLVMATQTKSEEATTGEQAIVSTSTVDDQVFLYVRSPKETMDEMSYQIGTSLCEDITSEPINKLDVAMKTLVLVDNSFSISKESRHKIKELLLEFIAEKKDNELVRIATFEKQVNYLTDYMSDYTKLKQAVQSITYQDQETYLTDVLYTVLEEDFATEDDIYDRIIIFSDGVDNKAVGYTKEELYDKVTEKAIPIYTFGSSTGKNNELLKNMFALSRLSQATYHTMGELQDVSMAVQEMAVDRNIIRLQVMPPAELLDGSIKNSKLIYKQDGKEYALTTDVKMPFKVKEEAPVVEVVQKESIDEEVEQEPQKTGINPMYIIIGGVVVGLLAIGGISFVVLKKKKHQASFETLQGDVVLEEEEDEIEEPTEMAGDEHEEMTCRIWNEPIRKTLILTDMKQPAKSFQVPLVDSVVIGRSTKNANLVIDYDKSISAKHCEIEARQDNRIVVTDLDSSNGTYINGNRVLTETEISSGVIIKLGRVEFKLEVR